MGRGVHYLFLSPRSTPAVFYLDTRVSLPSFIERTGMVDHLLILKLEQHWIFALDFVVRGLA